MAKKRTTRRKPAAKKPEVEKQAAPAESQKEPDSFFEKNPPAFEKNPPAHAPAPQAQPKPAPKPKVPNEVVFRSDYKKLSFVVHGTETREFTPGGGVRYRRPQKIQFQEFHYTARRSKVYNIFDPTTGETKRLDEVTFMLRHPDLDRYFWIERGDEDALVTFERMQRINADNPGSYSTMDMLAAAAAVFDVTNRANAAHGVKVTKGVRTTANAQPVEAGPVPVGLGFDPKHGVLVDMRDMLEKDSGG